MPEPLPHSRTITFPDSASHFLFYGDPRDTIARTATALWSTTCSAPVPSSSCPLLRRKSETLMPAGSQAYDVLARSMPVYFRAGSAHRLFGQLTSLPDRLHLIFAPTSYFSSTAPCHLEKIDGVPSGVPGPIQARCRSPPRKNHHRSIAKDGWPRIALRDEPSEKGKGA